MNNILGFKVFGVSVVAALVIWFIARKFGGSVPLLNRLG